MNLMKRIAPKEAGEGLSPLLETHLDLVSGGANPGPGCSHDSSSCGPSHTSNTTCKQVE